MRFWIGVVVVCAGAPGCGREAAESARAGLAERLEIPGILAESFDPAVYDTVRWASRSAAEVRGSEIYVEACARCHGLAGEGGRRYAVRGDTIAPPGFIAVDWRFATDEQGFRRHVFLGTAEGMPHWGLRLPPRDLVAVETYIRKDLRRLERRG